MTTTPPRSFPPALIGLRDSRRYARQLEGSIGRLSPDSPDQCDLPPLSELWQRPPDTGNLLVAPPPSPTSGRTRLPSLEHGLSWEHGPYEETVLATGNLFENMQLPVSCEFNVKEISELYRPTSMLDTISDSKESLLIMLSRLRCCENVLYSGVLRAQEKAARLGTMPGPVHMVKIHALSGGAVTVVKKILLSMNFVETSISPICSGGLIVTRSRWRLKDLVGR